MDRKYATELMRQLSPELKGEFGVHRLLPLGIKLHLERLKLMELTPVAYRILAPLSQPRAAETQKLVDELKAARSDA